MRPFSDLCQVEISSEKLNFKIFSYVYYTPTAKRNKDNSEKKKNMFSLKCEKMHFLRNINCREFEFQQSNAVLFYIKLPLNTLLIKILLNIIYTIYILS